MTRCSTIGLTALLMLASTAASARVFEERLFATGEARPGHYAVLPPDVRIMRGRVLDSAPLIKESAAFEDLLAAEVASYLNAQGYEADFAGLSVSRLATDAELSTLVLTAKDRYGEAVAHASRDPRDIADGRFSIGESAAPVAAAVKADGLVFVRALSVIPSKGQRALSTTLAALFGGIPIPPQTQTLVEVGIVDARSGKLLTLRAGVVSGAVLKESQVVAGHGVAKALRDFPASGEPSPWGRKVLKRRAAGKDPPPPEIPSTVAAEESEVLSSFEQAYARQSAEPPAMTSTTVSEVEAPAIEVVEIEPAPQSSTLPAPDVHALFDMLPEVRPTATAVILLQVRDGAAGLTLRNRLDKSLRVSLSLGDWQELAAGAELVTSLLERKPWILVIDESGTEVARTACPPAATRTVVAEITAR